jgi:hypothetical protein
LSRGKVILKRHLSRPGHGDLPGRVPAAAGCRGAGRRVCEVFPACPELACRRPAATRISRPAAARPLSRRRASRPAFPACSSPPPAAPASCRLPGCRPLACSVYQHARTYTSREGSKAKMKVIIGIISDKRACPAFLLHVRARPDGLLYPVYYLPSCARLLRLIAAGCPVCGLPAGCLPGAGCPAARCLPAARFDYRTHTRAAPAPARPRTHAHARPHTHAHAHTPTCERTHARARARARTRTHTRTRTPARRHAPPKPPPSCEYKVSSKTHPIFNPSC